MEESAQRRERLKAMRMEASQPATCNDSEHSTQGLSNPLTETSDQEQVGSCATERFGFYTDPMAAFSGNKRRSKVSPQISQDYSTPPRTWNPDMVRSPALQAQVNNASGPIMHQEPTEMIPTTAFQPQMNYSSGLRMQQAQGHYRNITGGPSPTPGGISNYPSPFDSPRGGNFHSPVLVQASSPSFSPRQGGGYRFRNSPRPNSGFGRGPGFGQEGGPSFYSGQGRGPWFSNSPGPDPGRGSYPTSPGFGQGSSPSSSPSPRPSSVRGRGPWFGNSTSAGPSSGRGRGRFSGQNGGRGRGGSHNHVSAEDKPDLYYNRSMVEDPWKFLKSVIWRTVGSNTPGSLKPCLPNSISMKRPKVSESTRQSSSQPSLAEYLAASFNEAANEEPNV